MSISLNDIAGPDGESFKFENHGDTAKGEILHMQTMERENSFNGLDERVLRISLRDSAGDTIVIWPVLNTDVNGNGYASRMAKAIASAARAAGVDELAEGGTLAVKYDRDGKNEKGNPPKIYVAQYKPPAVAPASSGDDEGDGAVDDLI